MLHQSVRYVCVISFQWSKGSNSKINVISIDKKNKQTSEPRKATSSVETPPSAGEPRLVRVTQSLIKEEGGGREEGLCVSKTLVRVHNCSNLLTSVIFCVILWPMDKSCCWKVDHLFNCISSDHILAKLAGLQRWLSLSSGGSLNCCLIQILAKKLEIERYRCHYVNGFSQPPMSFDIWKIKAQELEKTSN